jgi:hypothetical protein
VESFPQFFNDNPADSWGMAFEPIPSKTSTSSKSIDMKTIKIIFLLPALLFFFSLRGLSEGINASEPLTLPSKQEITTMTEEQKQALVQQMKDRVEYIKTMDKSQLTKEERKALRTELKSMKREARAVTGVYISIGALIIIILLLIIIL